MSDSPRDNGMTFQFHATKAEVVAFAKEVADKYRMFAAVHRYWPPSLVPIAEGGWSTIPSELTDHMSVRGIVLSPAPFVGVGVEEEPARSGEPTLLYFVLPIGPEDVLEQASVYWCPTSETIGKGYRKILRAMKKRMVVGGRVVNRRTGEIGFYKSMWFSRGAIERWKDGVRLIGSFGSKDSCVEYLPGREDGKAE